MLDAYLFRLDNCPANLAIRQCIDLPKSTTNASQTNTFSQGCTFNACSRFVGNFINWFYIFFSFSDTLEGEQD